MNILAIGAHPDDIEMQCAGTLALYAQAGHELYMAIATNGNVGSPTHSRDEIRAILKAEQEASCKAIYENASITDPQQSVTAFRGAAADCGYAGDVRELRTYPRTGSFRLLRGQGL